LLIILFQIVAIGLLSEYQSVLIYLSTAGLAGIGALWAAYSLRKVYDTSLLNWRLSRSRRRSVLDGIDI